MFFGYGIFFFFVPPYSLIWLALLLLMAFAMVYAGKRLFHVEAADILYPGSLRPLVLRLWGASAASMVGAFILNFWISVKLPWVGDVHSEWGIDLEQDWGKYLAYISMWSLLYFALLMLTHFLFRRYIIDKNKARRMCLLHAAAAALVWELINSIPLW